MFENLNRADSNLIQVYKSLNETKKIMIELKKLAPVVSLALLVTVISLFTLSLVHNVCKRNKMALENWIKNTNLSLFQSLQMPHQIPVT